MSQEWLNIQSFFTDHELLGAINDLSIAIKQEAAGVQDVERERKITDRVKEPSEEVLGKQDEREDLLGRALASEIREHDDTERAAEHRDDEQGRHDPGKLVERQWDAQDEREREDAGRLR